MNNNDTQRTENPASRFPTIRPVAPAAILGWLRAGWHDCRQAGLPSLFYGACFAAAGWLMQVSGLGAPLVLAGIGKIAYDLLLWREFRRVKPPEER